MEKTVLKPFLQGHLDRYCGVYCVVNIVHYLRGPLSKKHSNQLFYETMKLLNGKLCVVERINSGTYLRELGELLGQTLVIYRIHHRRPFLRNKDVSLDHYWFTLEKFISTRKGIVLIGINGLHNHWTLVKEVTSTSLLLFDSDGIKRLSRRQCCITRERLSHRRHLLIPTRTYFIWTDDQVEAVKEVSRAKSV